MARADITPPEADDVDESLRREFDKWMEERDRRVTQRFELDDRALVLVREAMERRLDAMIDLRDLQHAEVLRRIGAVEAFRDNTQGRFWALGAGLIVLNVLVSIALHFWRTA